MNITKEGDEMSMMISKYVSYKEAIRSEAAIRHGVSNIPLPDHLSAMKYVATRVFDPVRIKFGKMYVSSFYRNGKVNQIIGGSSSSQHCKGEAIDIDCDIFGNGTNEEVFNFIKSNLPFDQLIWEFGDDANPAWVHVSLKRDNSNRKQVLRAKRIGGKTVYERI